MKLSPQEQTNVLSKEELKELIRQQSLACHNQ